MTWRLSSRLAGPVTVPTTLPLRSRATAVIRALPDAFAELTVTARRPVSMFGVVVRESMAAGATGSIQTVCQMPEDGV
ncbi:hypothetical protein SMICM17S_12389 [Streptomyces microflavus]